ncbi:hypothetical protein KQX54_000624, partial [Cotesia glomerata]
LLGRSCETDYDCQYISNAICIDKICVCKPDTFALTSSACTHLLNTYCSSSADCDVEASHCFENKCQCQPDWVALTDMMCVRRSALFHCKKTIECGELWHSRCYQNKCVCNSKHIAVNKLTCLPVLDGNCWRDDQCMTENSHCHNYRCQCKLGFVSVSRRSESTLQGCTDGNTTVLIPNVEIPDGSENRPISAGDYDVVEISTSN